MAIAHDAVTETPTGFTTTSPTAFNHTPGGTPRGVLVGITQSGNSVDRITGVTYGGSAMTRIATAADTAGETGRTYVYGLFSSVPTGTQSVSITHDGNAVTKWAAVVNVTAADDTEVVDTDVVQEDQADPPVSIDTGATTSLTYLWAHSGRGTPSSLIPNAAVTGLADHDYGNTIARCDVETALDSGARSLDYSTLGSVDDVAIVAVALAEVAAGGSAQPPRTMQQVRLRRQ